jgi:hypothetical protein
MISPLSPVARKAAAINAQFDLEANGLINCHHLEAHRGLQSTKGEMRRSSHLLQCRLFSLAASPDRYDRQPCTRAVSA